MQNYVFLRELTPTWLLESSGVDLIKDVLRQFQGLGWSTWTQGARGDIPSTFGAAHEDVKTSIERPIKTKNGKQVRVPSKAEVMGWNVIGGPPLDPHSRQEKRIPTAEAREIQWPTFSLFFPI